MIDTWFTYDKKIVLTKDYEQKWEKQKIYGLTMGEWVPNHLEHIVTETNASVLVFMNRETGDFIVYWNFQPWDLKLTMRHNCCV